MVNIADLIVQFQQHGITLLLDGENLRSRAAPGAIDAAKAQILRAHKAEIIEYLKGTTLSSEGKPVGALHSVAEKGKLGKTPDSSLAAQMEFWKRMLDGIPQIHSLPLDKLRGPKTDVQNGSLYRQFDSVLVRSIRDLANRHETNVFAVLYSALAVLFSRWSGVDDIIIGVNISGQSSSEQGRAPSLDSDLPLRLKVSNDDSFSQILLQCKSSIAEILENKDVSLPGIIEYLSIKTAASYLPIFQNRFTVQAITGQEVSQHDAQNEASNSKEKISGKYDVDVQAFVGIDDISIRWVYDTSLFFEHSIHSMAASFELLLRDIVTNENKRIKDVALLSDSDKSQIISWNRTEHPYPKDKCLHQLIEEQVARTPENKAFAFGSRILSYKELNEKANYLALQLQEQGIGTGDVIPVIMEGTLEIPVSYLALMKIGAIFAPLDINWPSERIRRVVQRAQVKLVLVTSPLSNDILDETTIQKQVDADELGAASNLNLPCSASQPIYVVHTSGSTGEPKGAVNIHCGIVNRLCFMNRYFDDGAADVVLQTTNHCFDSSVWQFFWPLINGGMSVMPITANGFDLNSVIELIFARGVTMTDFTPALLMLFSEHMQNEEVRKDTCHLRSIIVGGEELTNQIARKFFDVMPDVKLYNFYGPSETSIGVLAHEMRVSDVQGVIPIGLPIDNVVAVIVDDHLNMMPIGAPGELLIGGDCVGAGYLQNQELTNKCFIDNPFPQIAGSTLYRTGDFARYRPDGVIEYLGRIDTQVKIRGFRIELGEVQAKLESLPDVRQAAARIAGEGQNKEIVAFVVPLKSMELEQRRFVSSLQANLKKLLPDYMLPKSYVLLGEMPLTKNGKVNYAALGAHQPVSHVDREFVAPETEIEKALAKIWADLFGIADISLTDDFFELGGHSLSATQLVAKIRRELHIEVPLRAIFDNAQLNVLSKWCAEKAAMQLAVAS